MQTSFYEPRYKDGKIIAFADVDLADGVIVRGFRVVDGEKGLFAAVPSRGVMVDGQMRYMNQVVFANPELKERFLARLLEAYRKWDQDRNAP
ncbi:MAG TPA: septation protein SpoVG family protein [Vicinamibacteria bacterium]|nr:septation protein SpoVG family protein [Vicinamibacteria bacterium]